MPLQILGPQATSCDHVKLPDVQSPAQIAALPSRSTPHPLSTATPLAHSSSSTVFLGQNVSLTATAPAQQMNMPQPACTGAGSQTPPPRSASPQGDLSRSTDSPSSSANTFTLPTLFRTSPSPIHPAPSRPYQDISPPVTSPSMHSFSGILTQEAHPLSHSQSSTMLYPKRVFNFAPANASGGLRLDYLENLPMDPSPSAPTGSPSSYADAQHRMSPAQIFTDQHLGSCTTADDQKISRAPIFTQRWHHRAGPRYIVNVTGPPTMDCDIDPRTVWETGEPLPVHMQAG